MEPERAAARTTKFIQAGPSSSRRSWICGKAGQTVTVPVALYVSHEYQFHKFNAKSAPELVIHQQG
tara:strand:- start:1134 stop:1331 length:198 start_codon:yes stop_codon:yes gene_type:complete